MKTRWIVGALLGLVLAPVLGVLLKTLAQPLPDPVVHGDLALIELATRRAAALEQWTGAYSRFRLHHPGPALFYALAPVYRLFGSSYGALCLGAALLNAMAFLVLALVPWRLGGVRALALAAPFLALILLHAGPGLFWSTWNADAGILPLAAGVLCAFAVAAGRWSFLPAGLAAASFAAHCHVMFAPPLLAVWAATLFWAFLRRGEAARGPLPGKPLAAAAGVLVIFWLPVLLEELRSEPGNLSATWARLRESAGAAPAGELRAAGLAAVSEAFFAPAGYGFYGRLDAATAAQARRLSILLVFVVGAALLVAARRGSALAKPAAVCGLALAAGVAMALGSLGGELQVHFTRWLFPLGPLALVAATCAWVAIPSSRPAPGRPVWPAIALVLAAVFTAHSFDQLRRAPPLGAWLARWWGEGAHGEAVARVLAALEERGIRQPYIGIVDAGSWHYATALVAQLEKRGRRPVLYEDWIFMFGPHYRHGAHDGLLLLDAAGSRRGASPLAAASYLEAEPLRATLIPLPGAFERGGRRCLEAGDPDADLFLRGGFYGAEVPGDPAIGEPASRWSADGPSTVSVRLSPGRPYRLTIELAAHDATLPQRLAVSFNGEALPAVTLESGWRRVAFELPAERVLELDEVTLEPERALEPAEDGSGDRRRLAVRYRAICFEELRPEER